MFRNHLLEGGLSQEEIEEQKRKYMRELVEIMEPLTDAQFE
jgi:hypothetical protein